MALVLIRNKTFPLNIVRHAYKIKIIAIVNFGLVGGLKAKIMALSLTVLYTKKVLKNITSQ